MISIPGTFAQKWPWVFLQVLSTTKIGISNSIGSVCHTIRGKLCGRNWQIILIESGHDMITHLIGGENTPGDRFLMQYCDDSQVIMVAASNPINIFAGGS